MGRGEWGEEGGKRKDERPSVQSKNFLRIMPGSSSKLDAKFNNYNTRSMSRK